MRMAKPTGSTRAWPLWKTRRGVTVKSPPAEPRTSRTNTEILTRVLTSVRFWGGLSGLAAVISIALPWWGITVVPYSLSWGLFFGPPSPPQVVFFQDRLDQALSANYWIMIGLAVLTAVGTIIGASLKRASLLALSLVVSIITILSFLADVGSALYTECAQTSVSGGSCISGLIGQGSSGSDTILWGFQTGFYIFLASATLLLGTLALARTKRE